MRRFLPLPLNLGLTSALLSVNANNTAVPGQENAYGIYKYAINAPAELICYNITVYISGN